MDDPGNPDPDPEFYNAQKMYMIFVFLITNTNVYASWHNAIQSMLQWHMINVTRGKMARGLEK